jgi:hypothetical protein
MSDDLERYQRIAADAVALYQRVCALEKALQAAEKRLARRSAVAPSPEEQAANNVRKQVHKQKLMAMVRRNALRTVQRPKIAEVYRALCAFASRGDWEGYKSFVAERIVFQDQLDDEKNGEIYVRAFLEAAIQHVLEPTNPLVLIPDEVTP